MDLSATLSSVVARLAHARARAPSACDLVAALRQPVGPIELPLPTGSPARPSHTVAARGSTWRLVASVFPPGTSTALHVHRTPVAWRVLSGHALETVLGQHDRTWAPGEIAETSPGVLHQIGNPGEVPLVLLQLYGELPGPAPVTAAQPEVKPGSGRIVIVGGGLSAAALTYHLAIRVRHPLQVSIIERGAWLGRGIAYGVSSPVFRLNVPASRMSLDPQVPDDFARWAGVTATPDVFLARTRYGA
jgi:mannose-6-phosphate isomerase-like protein (cupin superfamily)